MDSAIPGSGRSHSKPSEINALATWAAPTSPESAKAFTVGMATALLAGAPRGVGDDESSASIEVADWERFTGVPVTEVTGEIVSPVSIPKTLNLKSFRYTALSGHAALPIPSTAAPRAPTETQNPNERRASTSPNRMTASLKSAQVRLPP